MATKRRPLDGLNWPLVPNSSKEGDRSTTWSNKEAFAAAAKAVDDRLSGVILGEKKWRQKYVGHINRMVAAQLESEQGAVRSSEEGLAWVHSNFEFIRDGKTMSLADAMSSIKDSFKTGVIKGSKPRPAQPTELKIPYKGGVLSGESLVAQVREWVSYGTIEPSAGEALIEVAQRAEWRDLSDKYFVLLGAGSAMGPLHMLLELGANIIAIDLDRPGIWKRLIGLARDSCGSMTFPIKGDKEQAALGEGDDLYAAAGCNLLTQTPEIFNWLKDVHPGKPLAVGAYAYLDGELHVRVSLAMDAIIKGLTEKRGKSVTPCYLCTPTDCHVIPEEANKAAQSNFSSLSLTNTALKLSPFFLGGFLKKNALPPVTASNGDKFYLVDGLVNKQGPNYCLAKRIQHWRAVVARSKSGCKVSSNIAPSTATASVTSNRLFAMAYEGMHYFKPMEVFQQETSNAVMGAMLLFDVNSETGVASPSRKLRNPLELFSVGSLHGGVWRCAYKIDSIGEASITASLLGKLLRTVIVLLVLAVVGGVAYQRLTGEDVLAKFGQGEL